MNDRTNDERNDRAPRKPYERPRVVETASFETLALACGKFPYPDACGYAGKGSAS
ncbi:MAG: hypothetical protein RLP09_01150 [Sandaracinaceae bacterium]